jgi:predicted Zn-dependent peptidase
VIESEIAKIENQKFYKYQLFDRTLNYVSYGSEKYHQYALTKKDLENLDVNEIVDKVAKLFNHGYDVYYYGANSKNEISSIFDKIDAVITSNNKLTRTLSKQRKNYSKSNVYLVDIESKQIEIAFTAKLQKFDKKNHILYVIFNEYLSTFVNERIRETKGLAYSAGSTMQYPAYADESYGHYTKLSTQTDKFSEALQINYDLLENMPIDKSVFSKIRSRQQELLNAGRITKNASLYHYERSINRGVNYDYRKHYIEVLNEVTLKDFEEFYEKNIKGSNYNLIIVGDTSEIDKAGLSTYGHVIEVSRETLYGS